MLKFTSMTINNFGPYEGEQTIDFGDGDGVTLIWGDNGHGKTLESLSLCLVRKIPIPP